MQKKINLAILSPAQNVYSETFIQAHKNYIDANISYYYKGLIPQQLEGKGNINPIIKKGINKLIGYCKKDLLWAEKKALNDSLKQEKIAIILAEYGTLAYEVLPVCKALNIPLIVHFHGFDASMYNVIEEYNNYAEVFEYANYVIAVSKVMEKKLLSLGCKREKLILNTYGPNDEFQHLNPTYSEELFVGIGRFVDKKAPYYTIIAFKEVVKQFPNAKLIIGGDGYLLNACHNLVKLYQLENNVFLPGIITPKEYQSYLLKARAFVQHSITAENGDMEGTPLAILEASSTGLAVISTNHAGIPDVIIHKKTGLLVDEHDVSSMVNYMIELLKDKNKAMDMGKAGKENIVQNFSMTKHINKLNELINASVTVIKKI